MRIVSSLDAVLWAVLTHRNAKDTYRCPFLRWRHHYKIEMAPRAQVEITLYTKKYCTILDKLYLLCYNCNNRAKTGEKR